MSSRTNLEFNWDRRFPVPINVHNGPVFHTLKDVGAYLLDLPKSESDHWPWERAAQLLMKAAEGGELQSLHDQILAAFFLRGDLVLDTREHQLVD